MRSCSCPKSWPQWTEWAAERAPLALAPAATLLVILAALAGCASLESYRFEPAHSHLVAPGASPESGCTSLFERVDREVDAAGVRDAGATIVNGYPYLRTDRFTASFTAGLGAQAGFTAEAAFAAWLERMQRLDDQARSIELANLGNLDEDRRGVLGQLRRCRAVLAAADLGDAAGRRRLQEAVAVPPDYDLWKRALGLYPLTRIPFAAGVRAWEAQTRATFAADRSALPALGRPVRYAPVRGEPGIATEAAATLARAPRDALGVPQLSAAQLERLFSAFAPEFVVNVASDDDRIGALGYGPDGRLRVDARRPAVYRRVSHARYGNRVLLQLNYSVWFASRPAESASDLLSGAFDGLIWRVTLAEDGTPIVFDSIHNCGCYHLFFPTPLAAARARPDSIDEWMFSPQRLPRLSATDRIALRLEAGTHYIQRVRVNAPGAGEAVRYAFAQDDELRSLPLPGGGRRSAFGPDGIVAGSERGERFLYWPMGVRNPGAMRQWGRHATAFVGMRHFDDADLIERYFALVPLGAPPTAPQGTATSGVSK